MQYAKSLLGAMILFMAGCAQNQAKLVDDLVDGGVDGLNSIFINGGSEHGVLRIRSRIAGAPRHVAEPGLYELVLTMPSGWGTLRVFVLPEEAGSILGRLGIPAGPDAAANSKWSDASVRAVGRLLDDMPSFADRSIQIDLHLSPLDTGRTLAADLPYNARELEADFLHGVAQRGANVEWAEITSLIVHELLHVHYALAGLRLDALDEEVAGYLTGICGQAWMGIEANEGEGRLQLTGLDSQVYQRVFPGLLEGRWDPHIGRLRSEFGIKHATAQARTYSLALLYHRYATEGVVPTGSRESAALLLDDCSRLPLGPPRYSKGETQPVSR